MEKWGRAAAEAAEQGGIVIRAKPADVPAEKGIKVSVDLGIKRAGFGVVGDKPLNLVT